MPGFSRCFESSVCRCFATVMKIMSVVSALLQLLCRSVHVLHSLRALTKRVG